MPSKTFAVFAVIGGLVAFAVFYTRPVFPDTASNHILKTVLGLSFKFVYLLDRIGGHLGFPEYRLIRGLLRTTAMLAINSSDVTSYRTVMDGVEVILYKPAGHSDVLRPGIVHIHGGGWTIVPIEVYIPLCEELVKSTGHIVISIDYRLAPENVYPVPLEDCLTATRYFLRNAEDFGVDANQIGVNGDSAGGNLASAVALKLSKEKDLPSLKYMVLECPALQVFDFNLPSYRKYVTGPGLLTKDVMISFWLLYAFGDLRYYDLVYRNRHITDELRESDFSRFVSKALLPGYIKKDIGDEEKSEEAKNNARVPLELLKVITDPLFAPLMASDKDLAQLPPTYIFNSEIDVLRDEGLILAERLKRVGVKVTSRFLPSEQHGYLALVSIYKTIKPEIVRIARFINETLNASVGIVNSK